MSRFYEIVNDAAIAFRGVIPLDRWKEPSMPREEIEDGVRFWAIEDDSGDLIGVMGIQDVGDVTLIRHARAQTAFQGRGIGGELLARLIALADPERPILVGPLASADEAARFYERHGFRLVTPAEKNCLLKRRWRIPDRQVETSVVLAGDRLKKIEENERLVEEMRGRVDRALESLREMR